MNRKESLLIRLEKKERRNEESIDWFLISFLIKSFYLQINTRKKTRFWYLKFQPRTSLSLSSNTSKYRSMLKGNRTKSALTYFSHSLSRSLLYHDQLVVELVEFIVYSLLINIQKVSQITLDPLLLYLILDQMTRNDDSVAWNHHSRQV